MNRLAILGVSLLLGAAPAFAISDAVKVPYDTLVAAMRDEVKTQKIKNDKGAKVEDPTLKQAVETFAREEVRDSIVMQGQILEGYTMRFKSPAVQDAVKKLKLAIETDKRSRQEEAVKAREALIQRSRELIGTAKSPEDLDALLSDLADAQNDLQSNEQYGVTGQQFRLTRDFMVRWQDYLAAKQNGGGDLISERLQMLLSSDGASQQLVPRSQLLRLADEAKPNPQDIAPLILSIDSLDDIRGALLKIERLRNSSRRSNDNFEDAISQLASLDKSHREFLAGLPVTLDLNWSSNGSSREIETSGKLVELRSLLLKEVLPRFVDAPADTVAKPGEPVNAFLDRIEEQARTADDSGLILRIREARQLLNRGSSFSSEDTAGLKSYLAGQNQEAAGQYTLAVISYQQALKSGSDLVPAKTIGQRLQTIKDAHPDDFQKGIDNILSPPVSRFPNYPPQPNDPRANSQPDTPGLLIPAPRDGSKEEAPPSTAKPKPEEAAPKAEEKPEPKVETAAPASNEKDKESPAEPEEKPATEKEE